MSDSALISRAFTALVRKYLDVAKRHSSSALAIGTYYDSPLHERRRLTFLILRGSLRGFIDEHL